jgi:acylglycerol lipase
MIPLDDPLPQIGVFPASDGYRLHYRRWVPSGAVCGRIVAVHGIQSHSGWYGWSCALLARKGWDVWFADRRGSGMNEEHRGHAPSARRLIEDVTELLCHVSSEPSALPAVLLSMSWGGKLALAVAADQSARLAGLALLYPAIGPQVRPSWFQDALLTWCRGRGYVNGLMPVPLDDPALFTSDPVFQDRLRHDPLALHQATRGFLMASRDLDGLIESAPPPITCPVLVLLAGRDRIVNNAAVREFATRFRGPATIHEYPDAAHTLEFEPCRAQAASDFQTWLGRLTGPDAGG